ncbi:MAG TPA: CapA family protein [Baekduia sp.]|uniref:CapA family protein n=1 Tax=Baekduia sp. TaxID=2600305 RepID=UPI002D76B27B|nr:CapA family protein [Baekduia sp.]HET6509005.1 CapA family protein [Baekduia sp.]
MPDSTSSISVYSVGDVFADVEDGRAAFRPLEPLLAGGDVVFGNCEGVYCDRPAKSPSHKHYMGTTRERGSFFGDVGFDVMSLANNHMIDGGYVGLQDTADLLRSQGIATTGAGEDLAAALAPAILERDGTRVAFLGVCSVYPKGYEARPKRPGIAPLRVMTSYLDPDENFWEPGIDPAVLTSVVTSDLEAVRAAVVAARELADVVVIAPHWGYSSRLELLHDYELELARAMVDAGADAVLCCHHHAVRPIEFHAGRPIFYGLGALVHHFQGTALTPEMRADRDRRYGRYSSFTMPAVEFPLWPFAEDSRKTMVSVLDVGQDGRIEVGFFPAHMEVDGSTVPLTPEDTRAEAVAAYVERISQEAGFGTGFELAQRDGWAYVRVLDTTRGSAA